MKTDLLNIDFVIPTKRDLLTLRPVTKLNIFKVGSEFEPEGLFSTEIFGPIGSMSRQEKFGYIDLGVGLLHPSVYQDLIALSGKYRQIIHGEVRAIFDKDAGDFVIVNDDDYGDSGTGLYFFIKHIDELEIPENNSNKRKYNIRKVKKFAGEESLIKYLLVLPAGLRDYVVKDGKPTEDEINDKYRAILSISNTLKNMNLTDEYMELFNATIINLQKIFLDIYLYFNGSQGILSGKTGFIQGKWTKRGVKYGTRNVITPMVKGVTKLGAPNNIGFNDTVMGVYQFANAISPITKHHVKNRFISKVLEDDNPRAFMFDQGLSSKLVEVSNKEKKLWTSFEGLDKVLSKIGQDIIRFSPVKIEGHYPFLVRDNGDEIEIIYGGNEVGDLTNVRPMTYFELIYLSIFDISHRYPAKVTRFPVTGNGSTYPSKVYVKTTVVARKINLKNPGDVDKTVYEYPVLTQKPFNAMSPHYSRLDGLSADHDGDQMSGDVAMSEDAVNEIEKLHDNISYYITPDNKLAFSVVTDVSELVMKELTDTL